MNQRTLRRRFFQGWRRFRAEQNGTAAVEFALVLALLTVPVLNAVDLAMYAWAKMQLDYAAQVTAQAAWKTCSLSSNLPATPNSYANCPNMPYAVALARQKTSLGANVTVTSIVENYYCLDTGSNTLVTVGTFPTTKPANCGSVGLTSDVPGDYIQVTASYNYTPIFSGMSVVSLLATPITRTAWMRLG